MTDKKMLSICIITKNNEKYLSSCLKNIEEIADEIIIADMGSSDQTVEIAKQAGAHVYETDWNRSYSEVKNVCLNKAGGRWVLFLQANETISEQQRKEIPALLSNPTAEGYVIYVDQGSEQNFRISSPVQFLRLIRNRKDYRFQYRAFARIPDEVLTNIKDGGIRIIQQANLSPSDENDSLSLLLQEELKENPEDSYLLYMYGIELLNNQRYEEGKEYFQKALKQLNPGYLFAPHLYKCLGWILIMLNKHEDAFVVLEEGINNFPFYTDLAVLRSEVWKHKHKYTEAIKDLEKSIKLSGQYPSIVPKPEIDVSIIMEMLGEIHEQVSNNEQSLTHYLRAFQLNKNNQELLNKIGKLAIDLGAIEVIESLMKEAKEQKHAEQMLILAESLFQSRKYASVLVFIDHLEALIGKKEPTDIIKYICYMMLGDQEKADRHLDAINKDSPFYYLLLLKRIEIYWTFSKWKEVQPLLTEMERLQTIDARTKALYHSLHRLLTGKDQSVAQFSEQDYEMILALAGNFLWMNKDDKAKLLLPLLLHVAKDDQYYQVAGLWVERNDYKIVERIFSCISMKQNQFEFIQKIIVQMLRYDYVESAQKLIKTGNTQPLGALEHVLWASSGMKAIKKWIGRVQRKPINKMAAQDVLNQLASRPNKGLSALYNNLSAIKNNRNKATIENAKGDLTCTKIHVEIGEIFEAAHKKREALCAFLRALQWDPLNKKAQAKIRQMRNDDPNEFNAYLEGKDWILEGNVFPCKEIFINFLLGLHQFQNNQYEQALTFFFKTKKNEMNHSVLLGYIICGLWITGKEEQAEEWLKENCTGMEVLPIFFHICKRHFLNRLEEALQEYPHSELIRKEIENIKECKYEFKI
jgi:glycosyltransferase involved in cell wall biosynthesis